MTYDDTFALHRFLAAQEGFYETALAELRHGRKLTHWMWFVFPQIQGLGSSTMAVRYSIKSREEARQYLEHPVLGKRLRECAKTVLACEGRSASDIFGYPDDLKLKSSMTLFASVAEPGSVFVRILDKYYQGEQDIMTVEVLERH
ncbi:MAG: DUF1810 domain-containing protein [Sterolibacterium sp.]|jgi:uncharacterized protein (DUF1810 family)